MSNTKNKINAEVMWPSSGTLFSIKELATLNPSFVEITLRVRVTKAIEKDKTISIVGYKNNKKGRPSMILTVGQITEEVLNKANAEGIVIADSTKALVNVMNVQTPISTDEGSPAVTVDNTTVTANLVSVNM